MQQVFQESPEIFIEGERKVRLYKIGWNYVSLSFARQAPFGIKLAVSLVSTYNYISENSLFQIAPDYRRNECFYVRLVPASKWVGTSVSLIAYAFDKGYDPLQCKIDVPLKHTYQKFLDRGILVKVDRKYLRFGAITNEVSLACFLTVDVGPRRVIPSSYTDEEKLSRYKMFGDRFLKTLTSGEYSDLSVRVGNKTFSAHRLVLCARSSVFATMFQHPMKENKDNIIEVNDCQPEEMELFLSYLYSGTLGNTSGFLNGVFKLAHKYLVEELIEECEMRLIAGLNLNTCIETLKLAHLYERKKLQDETLIFVKENQETFFKTKRWTDLEKTEPELAIKVFKMCLTK